MLFWRDKNPLENGGRMAEGETGTDPGRAQSRVFSRIEKIVQKTFIENVARQPVRNVLITGVTRHCDLKPGFWVPERVL